MPRIPSPRAWATGLFVVAAPALAVSFGSPLRSSDAPRASLSLAPAGSTCEPRAPLAILVDPPESAGASLELQVVIEPEVDVLDLGFAVRLPNGGDVVALSESAFGARLKGERVASDVRIATPVGAGFAIELVATARISDGSAAGGTSSIQTVERVVWGEPVADVLGRGAFTHDARRAGPIASRDVPAIHRPAGEVR